MRIRILIDYDRRVYPSAPLEHQVAQHRALDRLLGRSWWSRLLGGAL